MALKQIIHYPRGGVETRGEFESLRLDQELVELPKLIVLIRNGSNGSEHPLCHGTTAERVGQCEDFFLNLWSKT